MTVKEFSTELPSIDDRRRVAVLRLEFRRFWLSSMLPVALQLGLEDHQMAMLRSRAWARWRSDAEPADSDES